MSDGLDAAGISDALTKKIGGLPGFAWVGIGLGRYLLYKKYKGGSTAPATSTAVTDPSAASNTASTASNTQTDQYGNPIGLPIGSNALWAATAANQLTATSSYSPSDIQTALANYQTGNGLTANQQHIIDSVLSSFGTPPQGVIPVYQTPTASTGTDFVSMVPSAPISPITPIYTPVAPQAPTFTTPTITPGVSPGITTYPQLIAQYPSMAAPTYNPPNTIYIPPVTTQPANYSAPAAAGISGTSARGN